MKRLLLFAVVATLFAACTQDIVVDVTNPTIDDNTPETLVVGFEGDDTRIQLNDAQKTVWTSGDLVSVFYRSDANQKWQYTGETGARTADLTCVDAGEATATMNRVVVVYPYNENYYFNTESYNVQASLPATQTYLKDSYGLDGNIMISSSEYNQFSLKSVCGWLKLQLTGDGEKVKSITLRGNNGEQVAGELYINSADATSILASDSGASDDDSEAGGSLIFEDTILTEVTLGCSEGVELGAEATAFYIALPPQTFDGGITVEIATTDGATMTKSTDNSIVIERNHIQPMTAFVYTPTTTAIPKPANNEIWYTNGSTTTATTPYSTTVFGANIVSNLYDAEKECWVITFDKDITEIGDFAFNVCSSLTSVTIGNSVTTIGDYAFYNCYNLVSVTIPDSVTTIGEGAFYYCSSLTSVTIPDSITTIGEAAFRSCSSLKEFKGKFAADNGRCLIQNNTLIAYANASGSTYASYTIPDSVTTIKGAAFYNCYNLVSVTIPDSVTTIGVSAFSNCDSLLSVTIGDSVATIGKQTFYNCRVLKNVIIGRGVTFIGDEAFWNCINLKAIYFKPYTPPTLGSSSIFSYVESRYIYVPVGCVGKYFNISHSLNAYIREDASL